MSDLRIGPFQLRRPVVQRDDEELWLAERVAGERPPRWVAIRRATQPTSPAAERLLLEYDALRAVTDPRLPAVVGHFPGRAALAVAWAPGVSLDHAARAHRSGAVTLDAATVVDLAAELAACMRVVHQAVDARGRPMAHGHLHLGSLRLAPDGSLAVLGLGRPHRRSPAETMAPEVLDGGSPGPAADRWALGAMLVELLSGQPLLHGASKADRLEARVGPWVEPIAAVNPELGRILGRLLSPDPNARFPDEGELIRSLRQVQRKLPGVSDAASLGQALAELPPAAPAAAAPSAPKSAAAPTPAAAPKPAASPAPLASPLDAPMPGRLQPPPPPAPPDAPPDLGDEVVGGLPPGLLPSMPLPDLDEPPHYTDDDATEPLDPGNLPPLEVSPLPGPAPRFMPATSKRLGLGEVAAIVAVVLLLVVGMVALMRLA